MLPTPVALGSAETMEFEAIVPWLLGNQHFERVHFWITQCPRGWRMIFSPGAFLLPGVLVFGS